MAVRIFVRAKAADLVRRILAGEPVVVEDLGAAQSVGRALNGGLREMCDLVLGKNHEGKTVFCALNPPRTVYERRILGGSFFYLSWAGCYVREVREEAPTFFPPSEAEAKQRD
jgi:hypothetical protein